MPAEIIAIEDVFHEHWGQDGRDDYERPEGRYYASECWGCPAKTFFDLTIDDEPDLPHGIFERGRSAERFVTERLKEKYGNYLLTEVPVGVQVTPDIFATGRVDAVLVGRNLEVRRIWEVKCKGGKIYSTDSASKHHEAQLYHYLHGLQPPEGGAVFYVNASNYDDNAEIEVPYEEDRWDELVRYWISVHEQFENDQPVFEPKARWRCHFPVMSDKRLVLCDHYRRCEDYDGPGPKYPVSDSLWEKVLNGDWELG